MPETLLEIRLGNRFGHPEIFRQRALGPHRQSGGGHTSEPWVVLYVRRGSSAAATPDGTLRQRDCGTPAGFGGYAPNAMGNFCFEVTLSYRRLERPRRVKAGLRHAG